MTYDAEITTITDHYGDRVAVQRKILSDDYGARTYVWVNDGLAVSLTDAQALDLADAIYADLPHKDETAACTGCDGCQKVDPEPEDELDVIVVYHHGVRIQISQ